MKKWNWLLLLLIGVCVLVFLGYQDMDRKRTDTEAPEITITTPVLEASVRDPKSALTAGLTATDNVDGDVTASLVVESMSLMRSDGAVTVTYAAFDAAGNVAKAERSVKFTDYESPKFTMNGPLIYPYGTSFDILSTVGARDVVDGDIQHRVRATTMDETSVAALGTHYVQFQVTNSLGDTVKQLLPVEVYAADTYNASLTLTNYLIYLKPGTPFSPESYLEEFVLMGEETDLTGGLPTDYALKTKGQVNTHNPGTYTVEYRVTYTDRHETNPEYDREYTGYSKLIVIVEGYAYG